MRGRVLLAGLAAVAWIRGVAAEAPVTPLAVVGGPFTALAASPNGQTVFAIDGPRRTVIAFDPFGTGAARDVVAAPPAEIRRPVAVAAIPGDVLAVVWSEGKAWSLGTYRVRPAATMDAADQEISLGVAEGPAAPAAAVSRSRDWLVVTGLPAPLPPVVRLVFAGGRVRRLPDGPAADVIGRPAAVAVSPADELVVGEAGAASDALVYLGVTGRELLRVDAGVTGIRSVAFTRDDGDLYVTAAGGEGRRQQGLWRLDAVLENGRQAVRPTLIAAFTAPQAAVAVSARSLVVVHGADFREVSRVDVNDPTQEVVR